MSDKKPMARWTLTIVADTGYEATSEGQCDAAQYGAALKALHEHAQPAPAQADAPNDLARECEAVDMLLKARGMDPERYRTEGGAVMLGKLRADLADAAQVDVLDAARYRMLRDNGYLDRIVGDLHPCDEPQRAAITDRQVDRFRAMHGGASLAPQEQGDG